MKKTILSASSLVLAGAMVASGCSGDGETTATTGAGGRITTGVGGGGSAGAGGEGATGGSGGAGGNAASSSSSSSSGTVSGSSSSSSGMGGSGGGSGGAGGAAGAGGSGGGGPLTAAQCYAGVFVNGGTVGPNYDQYNPIIGSHCLGTNHQDITGIERVVFLGDSVTVGTPPTLAVDYYRSQLADKLAQKFGISAPNQLWKTVNFIDGISLIKESGAFASCSKWGANTDDLQMGGNQIAGCFAADKLNKKTLVVMTMGGNDIAALTKDASNGAPQMQLWNDAQVVVQYLRDAMAWLYAPGRFPNGINVVFANNYEFTDGTANVQTCDVSGLAGFDKPVPAPEQLKAIIVWINEQYMAVAKEFNADMIFLLEEFCGHGFEKDNPQAPCYRGPGMPQWFDLTCIHPNPAGHDHITDMFMAVVNE